MSELRVELERRARAAEAVDDPAAPFLRSMVLRCDIEQRRDDRVEQMLETSERIAGGAVANKAAAALPGAIDRLVLQRWWLAAGAVGALFAASISGAYLVGVASGRAAGEAKAVHLEAALGHELTRDDAAIWLALMRNNDGISSAPRTCAPLDGRLACQFELWGGPASPPPNPTPAASIQPPKGKK